LLCGVGFVRAAPQARFVLTELILGEVVTRVRARAGAERAIGVARGILDSRRSEIIFAEAGLIDEALDPLGRFADKRLSLTDGASFALIDRLRLSGAFAFDQDFRACGYRMVP
jgi:predicted nucleic acid-binding protein